MLTFTQMFIRLVIALAIGALVGWEREIIHKEAGIRTSMLVASGAALFAMIGMTIPYLPSGLGSVTPQEVVGRSTGAINVIANIVIGIGFLGAGLIFRADGRVHGLTTAALVWLVAALGALVGIGLSAFAIVSAVFITGLLYAFRKTSVNDNK